MYMIFMKELAPILSAQVRAVVPCGSFALYVFALCSSFARYVFCLALKLCAVFSLRSFYTMVLFTPFSARCSLHGSSNWVHSSNLSTMCQRFAPAASPKAVLFLALFSCSDPWWATALHHANPRGPGPRKMLERIL